jgi:hypothetical protein
VCARRPSPTTPTALLLRLRMGAEVWAPSRSRSSSCLGLAFVVVFVGLMPWFWVLPALSSCCWEVNALALLMELPWWETNAAGAAEKGSCINKLVWFDGCTDPEDLVT